MPNLFCLKCPKRGDTLREVGAAEEVSAVKGVQHQVVEITEPGVEGVERVLVFFAPDSEAVRLGRQQEEAERYAASLTSWKRGRAMDGAKVGRALLAAALVAGAALLIWAVFF